MKKIIKGKKYNTETAKVVGEYWNGLSCSDFASFTEVLYRKRNGEYFLHGSGGPLTKYKEWCGENSWRGAEKIIPLSYEGAREWAEENLEADEYEKEFGAVEETGETQILTLSVNAATVEKLRRMAAKRDLTLSAVVEELVG